MGFGGINCHITIESGDEPSPKLSPSLDERNLLVSHQATELFVLSGNTSAALLERTRTIITMARGMTEAELVDLAAQLSGELDPDAPLRSALIAGSPEQLLNCLQYLEDMLRDNPVRLGENARSPRHDILLANKPQACNVGFLFPGQGSQHLNMSRTIAERHAWAQYLHHKVNSYFRETHEAALTEYMYKSVEKADNSMQIEAWSSMLKDTSIAQPAICLSSLLWLRELSRLGIRPFAVGGHSLGELTAFHAAGAFDEEALLRLAILRGQVMATPASDRGIMASLTCSYEAAMDILSRVEGYAVVANINSPSQIIISGEHASIEKAVDIAAKSGIPTQILPVSNAFHSRFVSAAADQLRGTTVIPEMLGSMRAKLYSGSSGDLIRQGLNIREYFRHQAVSQVNFVSLVKSVARECDLLIEVGPGRVLSGLMKKIDNKAVCHYVEDAASLEKFFGRAAEGV